MTNDQIIDVVLAFEGGFTNHPADHGGPTNFGITASDLGRWRNWVRTATASEVQAMTKDEAREIYLDWYITKPGFLDIQSDKLKLILVDIGVLHGTGRATRWLQEVLGVAVDGVFGQVTRNALNALTPPQDQDALARKVLGRRFKAFADIVVNDTSQLVFLRGWIARSVALLMYV
ncbi:conserved hypothetical protein [Gammaproteobacteria bacterium]